MTKITDLKLDADLKQKAVGWLMAKGLGVMVLVAWVIVLTVKQDKLESRIDTLTDGIIKENTRALYEFNLRNQINQTSKHP